MSKPRTARQLLTAFNNNRRDPAIQAEIAETFGDTACFAIAGDGIDVKETLDNQTFLRETRQQIDGALTFEDVLRELAPQYEADPITGLALRKGVTTDRYRVDWSRVSKELRLVVAYAVETEQLPPGSTSETIVDAILHDPLRAPWNRLFEEYRSLCESKKPADQARVLAIRGRLVYDTATAAVAPSAELKNPKISDPDLQRIVDAKPPQLEAIAHDDPELIGGVVRKGHVQIDRWACSLNAAQYRLVVAYVVFPAEPGWNLFQGGRSEQARHLHDLARRGACHERLVAIFDALGGPRLAL
jgi:hypothetical protein